MSSSSLSLITLVDVLVHSGVFPLELAARNLARCGIGGSDKTATFVCDKKQESRRQCFSACLVLLFKRRYPSYFIDQDCLDGLVRKKMALRSRWWAACGEVILAPCLSVQAGLHFDSEGSLRKKSCFLDPARNPTCIESFEPNSQQNPEEAVANVITHALLPPPTVEHFSQKHTKGNHVKQHFQCSWNSCSKVPN